MRIRASLAVGLRSGDFKPGVVNVWPVCIIVYQNTSLGLQHVISIVKVPGTKSEAANNHMGPMLSLTSPLFSIN
jgi:hypothetical protein